MVDLLAYSSEQRMSLTEEGDMLFRSTKGVSSESTSIASVSLAPGPATSESQEIDIG